MPIAVSTFEHLAGEMLQLYEEAEQKMLHRVASRLMRGITTPGWTERKYAEVRIVRRELAAMADGITSGRRKLSKETLNLAYSESAKAFAAEAGIDHVSPNTVKVASILSELNEVLDAADRMILRKASDAYADIVGRTAAKVASGTITVRDAVRQELDQFASRGITCFVDKAGRAWEMSTYAEMATLTAIERATVQGYVDTMQSYGYDLAVISSHVGACPICAAWQGVIVSVSGNDKNYPSLADAEGSGVFHPRCLHHLSTYHEGITKGTRSKPRAVQPPNVGYSTRQRQRALERSVRQWKRRMAVATTPQDERIAYAHVRRYQAKIRELLRDSAEWLPRKYWREGGSVKLSQEARRLRPITLP